MPAPQYPQVELATSFKNLASVSRAAGYAPVYKGKFHCNKPANGSDWVPEDVDEYGFTRWNPPDAGADQSIPEEGGGLYDNDGRFINSVGTAKAGTEGAVQYLRDTAAKSQPFFMVVSLVNPHDVLFYPSSYVAGGYNNDWLEGEIGLPATVNEDLSTKPTVQAQFRRIFNLTGPIPTPEMKRNYLNFYGNLMKASDRVPGQDPRHARVARPAGQHARHRDGRPRGDGHGPWRPAPEELQLLRGDDAHPAGLLKSPLPPRPEKNNSIVSHVDFLPTLAGLLDTPSRARANWEGVNYSDQILRRSARPPQTYTVFTYDDWQSGQASGPYPKPSAPVRQRP